LATLCDRFLNWAKSKTVPKTAPDFVIAGAPKCGTTSLHQWLNQHPAIHMLPGEPHFFSEDLAYNDPPMPALLYRTLLDASGSEQLCGERSTWYLYSTTASQAIHAANPAAKIVILVRQPADMLYSVHSHYCQRGQRENEPDLLKAMALEADRRQGRNLPEQGGFPEKFYYSMLPDYASGIKRFQKIFGAGRVKIVVFDDLKTDPQGVYDDVLDFLELDKGLQPDFKVYNQAAPLPDSLFRRLWRTGTWRYAIRRLRPKWWQRFHANYKRRRRARAAARNPRPPFSAETRGVITRRFEAQIKELEEVTGRDLNQWRIK
jgi:hypothetical protein